MRTAIISDLHLGLVSGGDVLRDAEVRAHAAGRDRRRRPARPARRRGRAARAAARRGARARPALLRGARRRASASARSSSSPATTTTASPSRCSTSLSPTRPSAAAGASEQRAPPTRLAAGPTAAIAAWLGPARLRIAYPGIWLRDDVYATHGHYMDAHLSLPRAECLAVADADARSRGQLPDQRHARRLRARPAPALRLRLRRRPGAAPAAAGAQLAPLRGGLGAPGRRPRRRAAAARRLESRAARAGFPLGVAGVNRLLRADFDPDISGAAIFRSGVDAARPSWRAGSASTAAT